jgi:hypothetical protein
MWLLEDSCRRVVGVLAALLLLSACDSGGGSSDATPATPTSTTSAPAAVTTATADGARMQKWIELQVGDCLVDPPPTDPSVVTVSVVDCAIPHAAEVFLRADVQVNAAIADVADRQCCLHRSARRRPVRDDVPHRFQSGSDVGQSAAQHGHLPASGVERWAVDGIRAPLMRMPHP